MTTMDRIAAAMGCAPADDDDLVEAVRLLVAERDGARAELEASERARYAAEDERDTVLELVADDAVAVARARDDRDAARLAALASLRVALADAEAECARLRGELAAVRRAVRMLDGARAAIDAHGQRVLRSLAGEERAALLEELAAARRERDDWNASATAMEAERDRLLTEAVEAVAAERTRQEAAEASATRSADAAETRFAALAAAVREERAVREEHEHAWAQHITADDLAGAKEVLALDARLDAARAALDAALGAT
jgi:hypothetical protein